ncbi:MAG: regulatory protein RecX [Coriobacteriales bacterium]
MSRRASGARNTGRTVDPTDSSAAIAYAKLLITTQERSSRELFERLVRRGFSEATSQDVVERCKRASLVDDARYASMFVRSKVRLGWGRGRIVRSLEHAGIDVEHLSVEDDLPGESEELERACRLLERHHTSSKHPQQARYAYLVRKGFSADVARRAVHATSSESD